MLGHYLETRREAWPLYLQRPPRDFQAETLEMKIEDVPSFNSFDFVGLSNIFDWSSPQKVKLIAERLERELPTGAVVVWRQLNNPTKFESHFKEIKFDEGLAHELLGRGRALFYNAIKVGIKS